MTFLVWSTSCLNPLPVDYLQVVFVPIFPRSTLVSSFTRLSSYLSSPAVPLYHHPPAPLGLPLAAADTAGLSFSRLKLFTLSNFQSLSSSMLHQLPVTNLYLWMSNIHFLLQLYDCLFNGSGLVWLAEKPCGEYISISDIIWLCF